MREIAENANSAVKLIAYASMKRGEEEGLSKQQRIEELGEKISLLREQKDRLEAEAHEYAEKRDRLNEQSKKLRDIISALKGERDEANEKVRELKLKRGETKTKIQEKIQELRSIREEIKAVAKKKPSRTLKSLQQQFDSIEWKIQTTPMSLQEEKELVEEVKQIETRLNVYKKLERLSQENVHLQAEIKALQAKGQSCHEALTKIAQRSQECHEKMQSKIEELKKIEAEADRLHQTFAETRTKTRPIQGEIATTLDQVRHLKGEIREEEEMEKRQTEGIIRDELERQAREKIRRGEKLTWEEFQIIAEKGMDTENKSQ